MKVLVSGSRDIDDRQLVYDAIRSAPFEIDTIVHGGASGVDQLAADYSIRKPEIDVAEHPIPAWVWNKVGRKAGPLRNSFMVEQADALVAIWDGESSGTKDTISQAESEGLPVFKVLCSQDGTMWTIDRSELIEADQSALDEFC